MCLCICRVCVRRWHMRRFRIIFLRSLHSVTKINTDIAIQRVRWVSALWLDEQIINVIALLDQTEEQSVDTWVNKYLRITVEKCSHIFNDMLKSHKAIPHTISILDEGLWPKGLCKIERMCGIALWLSSDCWPFGLISYAPTVNNCVSVLIYCFNDILKSRNVFLSIFRKNLCVCVLVVWGCGSAFRAGDHGAGTTGECVGHLSSGRHALSAGILSGQKCRWTQ